MDVGGERYAHRFSKFFHRHAVRLAVNDYYGRNPERNKVGPEVKFQTVSPPISILRLPNLIITCLMIQSIHKMMHETENLELYAFDNALLNYLHVIFIKPVI